MLCNGKLGSRLICQLATRHHHTTRTGYAKRVVLKPSWCTPFWYASGHSAYSTGCLSSATSHSCSSTGPSHVSIRHSSSGFGGWRTGGGSNEHKSWDKLFGVITLTGAGLAASVLWQKNSHQAAAEPSTEQDLLKQYGVRRTDLPEYSLDDVAKHDNVKNKVWVCFNAGVYDITDFIKEHPGGDKILLGAGGSVEPFWALYAVHKSARVLQMLEKYRIGNLLASEVHVSTANMASNPYAADPRRHPALRPASVTPFNAEPPLPLLVDSLHTPNELFYVRNHLPVPEVCEAEYELEVCGEGLNKELTLTLDQLKSFPRHTITAAVQCGGNRRGEMVKIRPVKGLSWGAAAISNATWTGARLSDVLREAGLDEETTKARHVQFEGLDLDPTSHPYGASIPLWKAADRRGEVLLAYEMNGQTLPRDHGYPVRVIVPGVVGARNVKWLGRIVVSEDESPSHWQQNDYKGFAPNVDWDTVDFSKSPAIQEMPVVSAICDPAPGEEVIVKEGKVTVRGYAYSGGGRKIVRVDISSDGGDTWRAVDKLHSDGAEHPQAWGWSLWTANVAVPAGTTSLDLVVKAVDSQYNSQPENFKDIWNLRGVLSNAYHRVTVSTK